MRQRCVVFLDLFNLYNDAIFRELETLLRFIVGGRNLNIIYVDDNVLMADSERKLHGAIDRVEQESQTKGLKINYKKTENMVTSMKKCRRYEIQIEYVNIK